MRVLALAAVLLATPSWLLAREGQDLLNLRYPSHGDSVTTAEAFLRAEGSKLFGAIEPELRLSGVRQSLTGSHVRYQQFVDSLEVVGGELVVDLDSAGRVVAAHDRTARGLLRPAARTDAAAAARAFRSQLRHLQIERVDPIALVVDGELRRAWRVIATESRPERIAYFLDQETLRVVQVIPLFWNSVPARVFEANPVTLLNDPSLQDNDDSASAVPVTAYSTVELPDVSPAGILTGPNITIADLEAPKTQPADPSLPLEFDRSMQGFEEVMAYYQLDRSQRHIQSLGYTGSRRIITHSLRVDAHGAGGSDNSYYAISSTGEGILYFGDGGVDDAEDPDILLHEYGHAIHEAIAPGAFFGAFSSQGRALGEGFGDYWAFSTGYSASIASGRDPFCVGDWDARCAGAPSTGCVYPPAADCLRRVDGTKTMDQFIASEQRGTEHKNGEIWSSALREIFIALVERYGLELGRRTTDQMVLESMFGMPPSPTFRTAGQRLLLADRLLFQSANSATICAALTTRKIFTSPDCSLLPKGDFTLFPAVDSSRDIPDNIASGIVSRTHIHDSRIIEEVRVRVDIVHPFRGDLRLNLTGPNGVTIMLQTNSNDSADDLRTTFGLDTQATGPLEVFRGIPARGDWELRVSDVGRGDIGRLLSWGLIFKFQGDVPITERSSTSGTRRHLAIVGDSPGGDGSHSVTDVRIFNRGARTAVVTMFFSPSGSDGSREFAAMKLAITPGQLVALDDIVPALFGATGSGNVEFRGEVAELLITSRSYNAGSNGTYGQFVPSMETEEAVGQLDPALHLPHLRKNDSYRTDVGLSEVAGASGVVQLSVFDSTNRLLEFAELPVSAHGHVQVPVLEALSDRVDIARAELRVRSGNARIIGYASAIDRQSGDAMFIPAQRGSSDTQQVIPGAIHANGAFGTAWQTDLALTNLSASPREVEIRFTPAAGSPSTSTNVFVLGFGISLLEDVLASRFAVTHGSGQLVTSTLGGDLLVTSRTWTPGPVGSSGQFIGSRKLSESIGIGQLPVHVLQLQSTSDFRTNLGISEVAGAAVTVRVRLFDSAGTEIFSTDRTIAPRGQLQFNLAWTGAPPLTSARASFEVIAGSGRVFAYASVIDNRSGDPMYIPAR